MGRVFYTELPSHLKLTLLALADVAEDDGSRIMLGQARIARKAGCDERSVRRHLTALRMLGYVEKIGRVGPRGQDRHRIIVEALPTHEQIALEFARPDNLSDRTPVADRQPVTESTGHPASVDRTPAAANPSVTHQITRQKELAPTSSPRRRERDRMFETLAFLDGFDYTDPGGRRPNDDERGKLNRAAKLTRQSISDDVDLLNAAIRSWPEVMGDALCTARGVSSNIGRLIAAVEHGIVARRAEGDAAALQRAISRPA
jgi:hypothetical protein